MKISKAEVWGQIYLLPYIKVTHTRDLNGDLELIFGWLKWELVFSISDEYTSLLSIFDSMTLKIKGAGDLEELVKIVILHTRE